VPHHHDRVIFLVARQHRLKLLEVRVRPQRVVDLNRRFKSQFIRHQRCCLPGTLQRTADNLIHLNIEISEKPANVTRLKNAFFIQSAAFIFFGIEYGFAGGSVSQEV